MTALFATDQAPLDEAGNLQAIIDSPQNLVIFALDREYRYLAFNELHRQTMKAIWNVAIRRGMNMLTEVIGREDDRIKARAAFNRALAGERFVTVEAYGDDQLSRRTYETAWAPIYSSLGAASGQVVGLTCFLSDVTDKVRSQAEHEQLRADAARQNELLARGMQENAQLVEGRNARHAHSDSPNSLIDFIRVLLKAATVTVANTNWSSLCWHARPQT